MVHLLALREYEDPEAAGQEEKQGHHEIQSGERHFSS